MARRGLKGQLNMFDFFHSLEEPGEVEMVSLVPEYEEEPEPMIESASVIEPKSAVGPELVVEPESVIETEAVIELEKVTESEAETEIVVEMEATKEKKLGEAENVPASYRKEESVVMSRSYERNGVSVEIAYLNYNKVRIQRGDTEPEIKIFASSKEAVDYYVEVMQEYEIDV